MSKAPNGDSEDQTRTYLPLANDTIIGHYRIIEKIGAGGMGEVYLAEDTELNRKVALKFLPLHLCQDTDCRARFKREAQAAAQLDNPNIVTVHEVGEFQSRPFFSMQHVEGQSLKEVLAGKALPLDRIIDIGIQVCEGLQAAHEKGITHRDIKPSNILIDSHGRARIVDFGLASVMGTDHLTKTGSTLGTIGYMSPEQVRGQAVDHRTDLFSFGVVFYEMITGQAPFKAGTEAATLHAITNTKPELLARYRREIPPEMQTIIDKVLEKDVSTRYQHADDFAADLRRLSASSGTTAKLQRDRWNRYVVMSSVAALLIVAGYWLMHEYLLDEKKPSSPSRKMVAVLPFENLGNPEDEYFADGITEEVTTNLAGLSGLGVISRTSSMQYKKSSKSLKQIGKELGVEYVLEGTIRWEKTGAESRVRINPQLIRVSDDSHVWANRFDAVLTDVFQVQSTIAHEVATALDVTLLKSEQQLLARKLDVEPRAYDYYLRGKQYFSISGFHHSEIRLAEKMQLQAVRLAPAFTQAYAELGSIYTEMHWQQSDTFPRILDSAKRMIDIAMRLDRNVPEPHEALGWYYYHGLRDFNAALAEFSAVLKLQPNNALALASTAWVQRRQGKWQETIAKLELVNNLDPRDPWFRYELGITYQSCRRYSEAIDQYDQAIALLPDHRWAYILKSWAQLNLFGRTREARAVLESARADIGRWPELTWFEVYYDLCDSHYDHALSLLVAPGVVMFPENPDSADYYSMKGLTYNLMGRKEDARAYLDSARIRLELQLPARPNSAPVLGSIAKVYAGLGQNDKAIAMAQRAVEILPVSLDALDGPKHVRTLAVVYSIVGQPDQAIDQLSFLLTIPSNVSVNALKLSPEFAPLRNVPKFKQLLTRYEQNDGT